jgi:hypothetical protein
MSITLELSEEEHTFLERAAAAAGSDVATYIRQRVFSSAPSLRTADDEVTFLRGQARTAVRAAQQNLLAQGIGYVFVKNGNLVRHNPDGTEEVLSALTPLTPA